MFEISDETLIEMQHIKETCEIIDCHDCNYYDRDMECYGGGCDLNFPYNWILKSEAGGKNEVD